MHLPNFIGVGTQKAGTTTIHDCLMQHPEIFLPLQKETKFFIDNEKLSKGIKFYSNQFFSGVKNELAIGEIDPDYMLFDQVPGLLKKNLGSNLKIIFFLRNPMDRAFSHYLMSVRNGFEKLGFREGLLLEEKRLMQGYLEFKRYSYVTRGLYKKKMLEYYKAFPPENIKVYFFERDINGRIEWLLKDLCNFLEVDKSFLFRVKKKNQAKKIKSHLAHDLIHRDNSIKKAAKQLVFSSRFRNKIRKTIDHFNLEKISKIEAKISPEIRKDLYEKIFKKEIESLEGLIGQDLGIWKL